MKKFKNLRGTVSEKIQSICIISNKKANKIKKIFDLQEHTFVLLWVKGAKTGQRVQFKKGTKKSHTPTGIRDIGVL